jgi:cadmium resistance transport/sequestration family protein
MTNDFLRAIATAIIAFIATNIDDILVLMLFFTQRNKKFTSGHIFTGQYLGFTLLILASLPGFFGSFLISKQWIGLLGFVPIALGLWQLFKKDEDEDDVQNVTDLVEEYKPSLLNKYTYTVAAVTVANGGDNLGLYLPLFSNSNLGQLMITLLVFYTLVGLWCYLAYVLIKQRAIALIFTKYIHIIIPFVWIGLGISILWESGTIKLILPFLN